MHNMYYWHLTANKTDKFDKVNYIYQADRCIQPSEDVSARKNNRIAAPVNKITMVTEPPSVSKNILSPWDFLVISPQQLRIFKRNFTNFLYVCNLCIYAKLPNFIPLSLSLTKLCPNKRDCPVNVYISLPASDAELQNQHVCIRRLSS